MKKYIIAFVLGAIIFSGISGVTAYTIIANNIDFQSKNSNWNVNNVGDALNSLYTMKTSEDYSTDEKRIGTWIDGKPLYQRSYNLTTPSVRDEDTAIVTFTSDINVVNIFGMISNSGVPINYTGSTSNWYSRTRIQDGKIYQQVAGYLNTSEVITIQYIKSTDTTN